MAMDKVYQTLRDLAPRVALSSTDTDNQQEEQDTQLPVALGPVEDDQVGEANDMGITALTEFHFFPKLPAELRLQVWDFAIAQPRIIELQSHMNKGHLTVAPPARQPPAIFHACKEARDRALMQYTVENFEVRLAGAEDEEQSIYFNSNMDTLYFGPLCSGRSIPTLLDRNIKIPRLAIDMRIPYLRQSLFMHGSWSDRLLVSRDGLEEVIFVVPSHIWLNPSGFPPAASRFSVTDSKGLTLKHERIHNRLGYFFQSLKGRMDNRLERFKQWVDGRRTMVSFKSLTPIPEQGKIYRNFMIADENHEIYLGKNRWLALREIAIVTRCTIKLDTMDSGAYKDLWNDGNDVWYELGFYGMPSAVDEAVRMVKEACEKAEAEKVEEDREIVDAEEFEAFAKAEVEGADESRKSRGR